MFSSPHGDFSFSIKVMRKRGFFSLSFRPLTGISLFLYFFRYLINPYISVFVPSRGFLFFYRFLCCGNIGRYCFRPLTGISLFLFLNCYFKRLVSFTFSSPHGDFSFSITIILSFAPVSIVFVPSRGFLFFYGFPSES